MSLHLIDFIKKNSNWHKTLQEKPFCINIKENNDYYLFKYNQIESDFHNEIVRECRGIILRKRDFSIACFKFKKFGNYGESYSDKINFSTARVQQKIDGSLIGLFYDLGQWRLCTNGMIDAFEANGAMDKSFGQLFLEAWRNISNYDFYDFCNTYLNKHYTYMFELVHPLTRVVVRYEKPDIYHIGTRDNDTLEEVNIDIGVQKPKEYSFNSLEDVIAMAQTLPYSEEGYVVVDNNWNRVKIKSPSYVAIHHIKNNGVVTYKRIMELVMKNESEEFLQYFPEFTEYFNKAENAYGIFLERVKNDLKEIENKEFTTRKDYAMVVTKMACPDFMFKLYDKKYTPDQFRDYLFSNGAERVAKILKLTDEKDESKKTLIEN